MNLKKLILQIRGMRTCKTMSQETAIALLDVYIATTKDLFEADYITLRGSLESADRCNHGGVFEENKVHSTIAKLKYFDQTHYYVLDMTFEVVKNGKL